MLTGATAQSEFIKHIVQLDKPVQFKKSIDLNVDAMGCWDLNVNTGASYFTMPRMLLSHSILNYDQDGTPYFQFPMQGQLQGQEAVPGLAAYRIEVHEHEGLLGFQTVWMANATAEQKLAVYGIESIDDADLALNLAFMEDHNSSGYAAGVHQQTCHEYL